MIYICHTNLKVLSSNKALRLTRTEYTYETLVKLKENSPNTPTQLGQILLYEDICFGLVARVRRMGIKVSTKWD